MIKSLWLNIPVKDVAKSVQFYKALGFQFNDERQNDSSACMLIGTSQTVVMLFQENVFKTFIKQAVADNTLGTQVLMSIDADSRAAVDELAVKVIKAGGGIYAPASESQGWLYGLGFSDLDGHRWNALFMDYSKLL